MNRVKIYLLWPIMALVLTLFIYLLLVTSVHKILKYFPNRQEEILWSFISDDLLYQPIDLQAQNNIQSIVNKLPSGVLPEQYSEIKIIVPISKYVNAFAAPGGRIIITTGLLEENISEQAILFIIGHEIAHLARKDHLYEYAKMLVAKAYSKITGSNLIIELLMFIDSYRSKETEFMADKYSAELLSILYNNKNGAVEFFKYLIAKNKLSNSISSSHPDAEIRLEKIKQIY